MNGIYVSLVVIVAIPAIFTYVAGIINRDQLVEDGMNTALWWIALGIFLHLLET